MTVKEAKEKDMVDYLATLGYFPQKVTGPNHWYLSPLHEEKTPSFKINRKLNRWKDFGDGRGGNLVDFGVIYHRCSVSDFLKKLEGPGASLSPHRETKKAYADYDEKKAEITILRIGPIHSLPLIKYYRSRRIPDAIAKQFLSEITYSLYDKNYYALGFKTDAGGYELRNEYIKAASMPKGPTFIDNKAAELAVFEGFFNFLSYKAMVYQQEEPSRNFLILNSTSFFDLSLPKMQEHKQVHLYLDNDNTGQKCTTKALQLDKEKFLDERGLYAHHKDLNAWLTDIGRLPRQQLTPRI